MAEKKEKSANKFKAINPDSFKDSYNDSAPGYKELSKGESTVLNIDNKIVKNWLNNNIIVKE